MFLRAVALVFFLLLAKAAWAGEPGSGVYAEDCQEPEAGFAVEIAADGTASVVARDEVYSDLLTSYSFFGVRTPADFHIAVLFDRERSPVPMKDGGPGWLEIWKGEAAYYLLVNGETAPRYSFCAELAETAPKGPSFDCARADGTVEELICEDPELARRDWALAAAYRKALGRLEGNETQSAHLKAEQRGWIKGRNDCWKAADLHACVSESYSDRHATLLARYGLAEVTRREVWLCGEKQTKLYVTAFNTEPETVNLVRGDESTTAIQGRSGSGVRYEAPFGVVFWMKGREAMLEWPQGTDERCRYQGPLPD